MIMVKQLDHSKEIREIQSIRRVQETFKEGKELDEIIEIENQSVEIVVIENAAWIYMEDVTIELRYDDVFMCIEYVDFIE